MCKDCGCSIGHTHEAGTHSHADMTHEHVHTHADGTVHSHAHMHEAGVDHEHDAHDNIHANAAISDAKTIEVMSKILSANDALCDEISRRYAYITVDEYQDTNDIQFKLLQK
ncbi:UvrD-helicase domain-containing protein, partial [uncultured Campylobacter sp.]|uniref:UvrD-helicase domain-containing protein n=1 Tax=uncultured Campylobacter sp. TaxID=218934 RepID=UPI0026036629